MGLNISDDVTLLYITRGNTSNMFIYHVKENSMVDTNFQSSPYPHRYAPSGFYQNEKNSIFCLFGDLDNSQIDCYESTKLF